MRIFIFSAESNTRLRNSDPYLLFRRYRCVFVCFLRNQIQGSEIRTLTCYLELYRCVFLCFLRNQMQGSENRTLALYVEYIDAYFYVFCGIKCKVPKFGPLLFFRIYRYIFSCFLRNQIQGSEKRILAYLRKIQSCVFSCFQRNEKQGSEFRSLAFQAWFSYINRIYILPVFEEQIWLSAKKYKFFTQKPFTFALSAKFANFH